ncbi:uncharacterized protein LOC130963126 [Arachis stenosperma]|uniref:uncharacterized protein LOC130963126 n=1 Tax=Arachis stenosperma TaxID=217475 RepID=UPI0025AD4BDA|nr:uncharacterized protein LOC130963126 [Arachis stenosperma]
MCMYIFSFAIVYTIEFQKRGLPHTHILLFLHQDDKFPTGEDIDRIISAEIPNKVNDPIFYEAAKKHVMPGLCGSIRKDSPYMKNGQCMRHFPKRFVVSTTIDEDSYSIYWCRDDGKTITKSGVEHDNRYVVPHNRKLLLKYGAHINVEWCHDRVTTSFYISATSDADNDECDEVSMYYDYRYISPCEAVWRVLGYSIHYMNPSVVRLGFHLPGEKPVIFKDDENLDDVAMKESVKESMFLGWFEANKNTPKLNANTRKWFLRKSHVVIGRIFFVPPESREIYYLRLLLNLVRGPTSYEQIRTIDGVVYSTFRDACYAYGLLTDDKEYIDAIKEASHWGLGEYLRRLYATLLFSDSMARPEHVWKGIRRMLCDDILHRQRRLLNNQELQIVDEELWDLTLIEIEKLLKSYNKSLRDFPSMPLPNIDTSLMQIMNGGNNKLISDEFRYDKQISTTEHEVYLQ